MFGIAVTLLLIALAITVVVWDVRTDGYRAHRVDPVLRQRLLDREDVARAASASPGARTPRRVATGCDRPAARRAA